VKLLIADDDPVSRHLLETSLTKLGFGVRSARDGNEAWRLLNDDGAPQLAILDWLMPGMDGLELCRELRRRKDAPYVYVILLTGKNRKEDLVEGLNAGADDFLVKPFDVQELEARLRAGRRILDLEAALVAAREALRVEATHDSLTGALNRPAVLDMLSRELNRARRERKSVGVLMADLDHFKQVNDLHGHLAGDAVLRDAVAAIRVSVRPYDGIGRYGGEEFVAVLPGCDAAAAVRLGERLRDCIGSRSFETPRAPIRMTASVGITAVELGQVVDVVDVMRAVDAALYEAKNAGRDRVAFVPLVDLTEDPADRGSEVPPAAPGRWVAGSATA
jgi:two-component system, cell cycle response regulator